MTNKKRSSYHNPVFKIKIRKANFNDAKSLINIEKSCFSPDFQCSPRCFVRNLKSTSIDIIVAAFGESVIGCIIIQFRSRSKKSYISSLAVLEPYRKLDIARSLKMVAEKIVKQRGCTSIISDVAKKNTKMIKLNLSLGYIITEHRPAYYGIGNDAVRMIKEFQ